MQRAREYEEAEWLRQEQHEKGSGPDDDEAALVTDELYCLACDKFFKTANAMANHERCEDPVHAANGCKQAENSYCGRHCLRVSSGHNVCRSKKHIERAEELRAALQEEEEEAVADASDTEHDAHNDSGKAHKPESRQLLTESADETAEENVDETTAGVRGAIHQGLEGAKQKAKTPVLEELVTSHLSSCEEEGEEEEVEDSCRAGGKDEGSETDPDDSEESLDEEEILARMLRAHVRISKPTPRRSGRSQLERPDVDLYSAEKDRLEASHRTGQSEERDVSATERTHEHAAGDTSNAAANRGVGSDPDISNSISDADIKEHGSNCHESHSSCGQASDPGGTIRPRTPQSQPGKAGGGKPRSKKDKRKAKFAEAMQNGLLCTVCKAEFETRNQLFKHIKERGHAQLK
jgi:hypothetical protein